MSIQTIIDNATSLTIDKGKVAAQSISRSGVVLTAERATNVPYRFSVSMHEGLTYSTNRDLLEELDKLDITTEEQIDIGSTNSGLSYVTAKLGTLGGSPTITSASALEIVVNTIGATGSGVALKKGDYIQPGTGYRYPYQVTADVTWNATSMTVPIHRPFIDQSGYTVSGKPLLLGNAVTWNVKMLQKVDYTILPYDRIRFNGRFDLVEIITT
jgi:hypothetical protein